MGGGFDGLVGRVAGAVMARANRAAEVEAVERLDPGSGDAVLALGFGPGVGVELLLARVTSGRVAGVDPAAAMVRAATRRNRRAVEAGRAELVQAAADALPWPGGSFDKAVAVNSLQLWDPLEASAGEVARVPRPGGSLVTLTHGWAAEKRAGSAEAWAERVGAVFEAAGMADVRWSRGRAERGQAVLLTARRTG